MPKGVFVGLPLSQLKDLRTDYVAAITALASGVQSYSIGGRNVTRVALPDLQDTLAELNYAIALAEGKRGRSTLGRYRRIG